MSDVKNKRICAKSLNRFKMSFAQISQRQLCERQLCVSLLCVSTTPEHLNTRTLEWAKQDGLYQLSLS